MAPGTQLVLHRAHIATRMAALLGLGDLKAVGWLPWQGAAQLALQIKVIGDLQLSWWRKFTVISACQLRLWFKITVISDLQFSWRFQSR